MTNWVIIKLITFILNNQLKYQRHTNMFIHLYTYLFGKRFQDGFKNSFWDEFSKEFGMRPGRSPGSGFWKGVSRKSARHIRSARRHDIFGLLLPVTQMW
jgi:hypothetical protein